jgi:hypothetical protein
MAIERWLNVGLGDTQYVVDLSVNFEELPADTTRESDESVIYTLVMESQVHVPANHHLIHALNIFPGANFCKRAPQSQSLAKKFVSVHSCSLGGKPVDIEVE